MEKLKEGFPDGIGGMSVTGEGACGGIPFVLFVEHKIEIARHPCEGMFRGKGGRSKVVPDGSAFLGGSFASAIYR